MVRLLENERGRRPGGLLCGPPAADHTFGSIASFGDVPATSALPLPSLIIGLHALASEPSRQRHDRLETVGDIAEVPDFPQPAARPLRRTLRRRAKPSGVVAFGR